MERRLKEECVRARVSSKWLGKGGGEGYRVKAVYCPKWSKSAGEWINGGTSSTRKLVNKQMKGNSWLLIMD